MRPPVGRATRSSICLRAPRPDMSERQGGRRVREPSWVRSHGLAHEPHVSTVRQCHTSAELAVPVVARVHIPGLWLRWFRWHVCDPHCRGIWADSVVGFVACYLMSCTGNCVQGKRVRGRHWFERKAAKSRANSLEGGSRCKGPRVALDDGAACLPSGSAEEAA